MNDESTDALRALPFQVLFCLLLIGAIVALTWRRTEPAPALPSVEVPYQVNASRPVLAEHLP